MTVRSDRVTCQIDASCAEWLEPLLVQRFAGDSSAFEDFEEVKHSRVRTVSRGVLGDIEVHLKLYRAVRLSDKARDALSGSRGVREFARLREARGRGLPAVRPLAAGRFAGSAGNQSFLVTESVDARPMARTEFDPSAAETAGRLLREAHDHGLHAPDLHPENLLLATDHTSAWLCDLTNAVLANPLEFEQRARALGFFCLELDGLVRDPSAAPLLSAYGASVELVEEAHRSAKRLRNRGLSAFGRRATRACRHTEVRTVDSSPPAEWFLHRPSERHHDAALAWIESAGSSEPVKSGRRGAVWVTDEFVVKERDAAAAKQLFRASYWLDYAGARTPRPIALRLSHGRGHVFVTRIHGPTLAEAFASMTPTDRLAAADDLGRSLGRLHALGLRNRDLKFENLILDPATRAIYLVDLDGVRRRKPLEFRGQGRDLGRLLAAYRSATKDDVDVKLMRRFYRSYHSSWKCLGLNPNPRLRKHSEERANEWARAHPRTPTAGSDDGAG